MNRIFLKTKLNYINLNLSINTLLIKKPLLIISGVLGNLFYILNFPLFFFKNSILYIHSRYKYYFFKLLDSLFFYVTFGFSVSLIISGLGIRASFLENSFIFDFGYSHILEYKLLNNIVYFNNKKIISYYNTKIIFKFYNKVLILKGIYYNFISNLASFFYKGLKLNRYRLKGLFYEGEVRKLKIGKRE